MSNPPTRINKKLKVDAPETIPARGKRLIIPDRPLIQLSCGTEAYETVWPTAIEEDEAYLNQSSVSLSKTRCNRFRLRFRPIEGAAHARPLSP